MNAPDAVKLEGLRKANVVRRLRADLKKDLAAGRMTLAEALQLDADWLGSMRVFDLLCAAPSLGRIKVNRALTANQISPSLTLANFPRWRREQLLKWLADNHPKAGHSLGKAAA